jgi:hypothetical protein
MSIKQRTPQHTITFSISVTEKEKTLFDAIALEVDMSLSLLMRHFIRDFIAGKITWDELLGEYVVLPAPYTLDGSEKKNQRLRTKLELEQFAAFTRRAEEHASTPSIVLRRLIARYISGKIEREDTWR